MQMSAMLGQATSSGRSAGGLTQSSACALYAGRLVTGASETVSPIEWRPYIHNALMASIPGLSSSSKLLLLFRSKALGQLALLTTVAERSLVGLNLIRASCKTHGQVIMCSDVMRTRWECIFFVTVAVVTTGQGDCWTYITAGNKTDGFGAQLQVKFALQWPTRHN